MNLFNKSERVSILKLGMKSPIVGVAPTCVGELFYEDNTLKFEGNVDQTAQTLFNIVLQQSAKQLAHIAATIIEKHNGEIKVKYIQELGDE